MSAWMNTRFHESRCRLRRLFWLGLGLWLMLAPAWAAPTEVPLRIGFPDSLFHRQFMLIADWRAYFESKLKRPIEILSSTKISNTMGRLYLENLDFAWVTDYPDVHHRHDVRLLAVPLSKGQPYFTSYLIVPAYNDKTKSLLQLKGAIFALSDASSNGSFLDVQYQLLTAGVDPARFFSTIIFTGSHRDVIRAVALGLAHAGEVDSQVWDTLAKTRPDLASLTRIVARSAEYAAPPFVANHFVNKADFNAMQQVLLNMASDVHGAALLKKMGLDGFIPGDDKLYERTVNMRQLLRVE